jgi:23S rRNA (uridine2552-2'-O)-methyltransferase
MAYNPKDFYFKKAKEQNFAARSIFKLEEIDQRFKLFKPHLKVLDLGCAPGSWTQYAIKKIGPKGLCIGIDLQKVNLAYPNAVFIQGDAFDPDWLDKTCLEHSVELFDIILSDMAPKTSGIKLQDQQRSYLLCVHALDVAERKLKPKGAFVVKLFHSDEFREYQDRMKKLFNRVEVLRPKSTRKASSEIYLIGMDKK